MATASDVAAQPHPQSRRRLSSVSCYLGASVALLGLWIGYYLFNPFGFDEPGRDSWHHVAVLRELMAAPFSPSNPHIPTDEPSRYFTPVAVVAALIGRVLGLTPHQLFGYMGAVTCVGLVAGCWAFARRYYASPWAPLLLLLTLLFAWGAQMSHAGLHDYSTLLSSAAYPSTIALVLGLFCWALVLHILQSGRESYAALFGLAMLSAVIFLTHQLSGLIVLAGAGSLALFHADAGIRAKAGLLAAMALGCLATLAWPYFPIMDVVSSASDARWRSASEQANHVSTMLVLMAPSFAGLLGFRRADGGLRWELLCPALLFGIGYVVLAIQGSAIAHRFPPAIILYNQLGLVWLILAYAQKTDRKPETKWAVAAAACILIAIAAVTSGAGRLRDLDARASQGSMLAMAEAMAAHMPEGSIAFATEHVVFPLQSTGRRVVSIPRPEPAAPSLEVRQAATDRFFDIATSRAERRALIARWGATHAVFSTVDLDPEVVRELRLLGPSIRLSHGAEIVAIDRSRDRPREASHAD